MSLFRSAAGDDRLPVFVLTGFLGSGKTTLLNRLLRDAAWADTAVIVNELGDVALDHLLVEHIDGEVALLRSGCVCCAVRSDFEETLRELLARRHEGSIPAFRRVVVETTGLADPAPLMQSVQSSPMLATQCRLGAVLGTVDAVNGEHQLLEQWEARKQVALADRLLLTKLDLGPVPEGLLQLIEHLNPQAPRDAVQDVDLSRLLEPTVLQDAVKGAMPQALATRDGPASRLTSGLLSGRPLGPLHGEVRTFVLQARAPLDWMRLQAWLADLRATRGDALLRVKGIVHITDEAAPLVLHGVHHLFHPALLMPGIDWPPRHSAIVFVVRGLDEATARAGFEACVAG
jgi:G3E family GTPase